MCADNSRITPKFKFAHKSEDIQIECLSSITPKWFFHTEKDMLQEIPNQNNILYLYNVQESNSGYYTCEGIIGNVFKFAAEAKLLVFGMF